MGGRGSGRRNPPPPRPSKKQMQRDVKAGLTQSQMATKYDVTQGTMSKWMKEADVQPNRWKSTGTKGGQGCTCHQPVGHLPNCAAWKR